MPSTSCWVFGWECHDMGYPSACALINALSLPHGSRAARLRLCLLPSIHPAQINKQVGEYRTWSFMERARSFTSQFRATMPLSFVTC